jgi:hypothetical protein
MAALLALAGTALLAALSRAPQRVHAGEGGLLRLSWSGQPERVEACREVPEEELEKLPAHMRQRVICEGRSAQYHLTVVRDGDTLAQGPVWAGGVRHDRPIYLYREFPVAPGTHDLTLRFALADSVRDEEREGDQASDRRPRGRLDRLPRSLALDTTITLSAREVVLVTYDPAREALVVKTGG